MDRIRKTSLSLLLPLLFNTSWNKASAQDVPRQKKPLNVLFLLSDDQRSKTIHAWGNNEIRTPNLDELAKNGTSFLQAHVMGGTQGAVSVPSWAMIMTGRYLYRLQ